MLPTESDIGTPNSALFFSIQLRIAAYAALFNINFMELFGKAFMHGGHCPVSRK